MSTANVPSTPDHVPETGLFDPSPLPHRPVDWRRAFRALAAIRETLASDDIMNFAAALEGDDAERAFQAFLREPGAERLLRERARLDLKLDDFEALGRLPEDSLGQAYRRVAMRDEISVTGLVAAEQALPDEAERCPDPVRAWFRARGVATHDLLHVLTGYARDERGELQLLAFSQAVSSKRVFRVGLVLGLLGTPLGDWPQRLREIHHGWRRGRAASIPPALDWESLLALPLEDARAVLHIGV